MERDVPWCGVAAEGRGAETWKSRCIRGEQGAPMLSTALLFNSKRVVGGERKRREGGRKGKREGKKGEKEVTGEGSHVQ